MAHSESTAGSPPAVRRFAALSGILRGLGAAILLSSASVFLFQGWSTGNDLLRYGALFGLSILLAGAGLVCGVTLRESKAARTLLGVALALVPVHTVVLGALLYSRFAWDTPAGSRVPAFGVWVAPSDGSALLVAGAAFILMMPIILVAARALVPPQARRATVATVVLNLPLLLPTRDPAATAIIVGLLAAAVLALELRWVPSQPCLRTFEGRLLRAMLAVPALLAFGRAHLHEAPPFLHGAGLLVLAGAMFALARRASADRTAAESIELLALVPGAVGWYLLISPLALGSQLLWLTQPFAALLLLSSRWSTGSGRNYRRVAAAVAVGGALGNLVADPGVAASLLCLGVGIAVLAHGFYVRQQLILLAGGLATAAGLVYQLRYALEIYAWSRWGVLAVVGLLTVLTAALLERYQERATAWVTDFGRRLGSWQL